MPIAFEYEKEVPVYRRGDRVVKRSGDYVFEGKVVCAFYKLDDATLRYVVQDDRGLLMIMSPRQLDRP